jgi:hypothetical protein
VTFCTRFSPFFILLQINIHTGKENGVDEFGVQLCGEEKFVLPLGLDLDNYLLIRSIVLSSLITQRLIAESL